jgi:hypothetical protein
MVINVRSVSLKMISLPMLGFVLIVKPILKATYWLARIMSSTRVRK